MKYTTVMTGLAGVIGLVLGLGLSTSAQVNPNPSIFQEAPYAPRVNQRQLEVSVPSSTQTMTLSQVLDQSPSFEMLNALLPVAGISASDLGPTLGADGNYTVFAPTDEAFAALPEGAITQLVKPENRKLLIEVLSYHVVSRRLPSSSIQSGSINSLQEKPLTIQVNGSTVTVNEARVVRADIPTRNGIIHAIDRVILPPDIMARLAPSAPQSSSTTQPSSSSTQLTSPTVAPLSTGNNNMTNPVMPGGSQMLR
ncbi:MAG: fasciclin domain-containing protein [Leptolyngbyaceae cyanobacterium bins.59]|nr:fasciclin domain-containing protein [Leptolyngbyaceae cyanobacterium bins.59]